MSAITVRESSVNRVAFFTLAALCMAPLFPIPKGSEAFIAPLSLVAGVILGLTIGNPYPADSKKASKVLLQLAVILLGFSLEISEVLKAGSKGILLSSVSIALVFGLGALLARWLKVRPVTSLLVSTGTAICGGSAIAAMSTVIDAPQEDVTVAVGTVFLLNGVGLIIFPPIGHALGLTDAQFGTWAGIAIHDVSSVVGAASAFGGAALATASAVKLSRVLYLVPATLIGAWKSRSEQKKVPVPWFVGLFLLASVVHGLLPKDITTTAVPLAKHVATAGFALSLFLIGSSLTRKTLKAVGFRPMLEGMILWLFISVFALYIARTI